MLAIVIRENELYPGSYRGSNMSTFTSEKKKKGKEAEDALKEHQD